MRRPTFARAAGVGLVLALAAEALVAVLAPAAGAEGALRLAVPLIGTAWLAWRLRHTARGPGRVTAAAAWCAVAAAAWLLAPPLPVFLLVHVAAGALINAFGAGPRLLPALAHLALGGLGHAVAAWAFARSGSVFLAAWAFFLVQALAAFIPHSAEETSCAGTPLTGDDTAFERARRRAEAALHQLFNP